MLKWKWKLHTYSYIINKLTYYSRSVLHALTTPGFSRVKKEPPLPRLISSATPFQLNNSSRIIISKCYINISYLYINICLYDEFNILSQHSITQSFNSQSKTVILQLPIKTEIQKIFAVYFTLISKSWPGEIFWVLFCFTSKIIRRLLLQKMTKVSEKKLYESFFYSSVSYFNIL